MKSAKCIKLKMHVMKLEKSAKHLNFLQTAFLFLRALSGVPNAKYLAFDTPNTKNKGL